MDTEKKSLFFVKKLMVAGISNIAYIRGIFAEDAFFDKSLGKDGKDFKIF